MKTAIIVSRWIVSMTAIVSILAILKGSLGPYEIPPEFLFIQIVSTVILIGVAVLMIIFKVRDANVIVEYNDPSTGLRWAVTSWDPNFGDQCINWHAGMLAQIKHEMFIPGVFIYDVNCASASDTRDFRVVVCVGTCIDP